MDIMHLADDKAIKLADCNQLPTTGFLWLDTDRTDMAQTFEKIATLTGHEVNRRHIKDCENLQHPCFYESTHRYDILIVRGLLSSDPQVTLPIVFLIFPTLLVTFSAEDHAIAKVKKKLVTTRKRIPSDPETLLFIILDDVIDNFLELKNPLYERFNHWQKLLLNNKAKNTDWLLFLNFKTQIRKLRGLSEEQLETVYQWRQDNELGLSEQLAIRYNDLADHIRRIIRYSKQLESDLDNLISLHYSLIGNKTNDIMRVLTVISAIFLPLNLIASIFGMNFVHMKILQSTYGLDIALIEMAAIGVLMYFFFKWKKWI